MMALWLGWTPAFLLPLITLSSMVAGWFIAGRDQDAGIEASTSRRPPQGLSPAETGTLVDESCDMRDIVATLVDLAVRGYIQIGEVPGKRVDGKRTMDYAFLLLDRPVDVGATPLFGHEKFLLESIFSGSKYPNRVLLSTLTGRFAGYLPEVRWRVGESLTDKGMFTSNPEAVRSRYRWAGYAFLLACVIMAGYLCPLGAPVLAAAVGFGVSGVIFIVFSGAMPAKTARGSRGLRECLGFRKFVRMSDCRRAPQLLEDDPDIFVRYLPHAVALGVDKQWAHVFAETPMAPPEWFLPMEGWGMIGSEHFVRRLYQGVVTMAAALKDGFSPEAVYDELRIR